MTSLLPTICTCSPPWMQVLQVQEPDSSGASVKAGRASLTLLVAGTLVWDAEELYRVREKSPRRSSVDDGIADSGKRVGTRTALLSPSCPIDSDPRCLLKGAWGQQDGDLLRQRLEPGVTYRHAV